MAIGEALQSLKTRLETKQFHLSCVYKCVFHNGVRASITKEAAGYKMGDDGENIYCPRCAISVVCTKKNVNTDSISVVSASAPTHHI